MNVDGTATDVNGATKTSKTKSKTKTNGKAGDSAVATAATGFAPPDVLAKTNGSTKTVDKVINGSGSVQRQKGTSKESSNQLRERIHKEAVIEALGDERVVDDDTFQRAVEARERRAWQEMEADKQEGNGLGPVHSPDALSNGHGIDKTDALVANESTVETNGHAAQPATVASDVDIPASPAPGTALATITNGDITSRDCASKPTTSTSSAIDLASVDPGPRLTSTAPPTTTVKSASTTSTTTKTTREPVAKDEEYLIGTERASAIAAWVLEAPAPGSIVDGVDGKSGGKKGKARRRRLVPVSEGA